MNRASDWLNHSKGAPFRVRSSDFFVVKSREDCPGKNLSAGISKGLRLGALSLVLAH